MLAAFLEWMLWLAAFLYCLIKVYQKAENVSTKIFAVVIMVMFCLLRVIFLPIILVTLPLPPEVTSRFPVSAVHFLQWFAFWTFSGLLTIPWLLCVYQLVTHSVGRSQKIKHLLDEVTAPKIVIVVPCYKEVSDILLRTVHSLVDCDYPSTCLHIFLSFDGDQEDDLYLDTIERLGVPLVRQSGFPTSIDVTYHNTRITVSRFPHGGKRYCQKRTFNLIEKIYEEYLKVNDNLFVLFIDSDCILDKACIQNLMYEMELKPGSSSDMLAMTGVITATTERNTLITLLQDMEYIHGQLFERAVESGCGAVTCLPGALTVLRFSTFRKLAKFYFADKTEQCDDLFDYGKCHLGEDRWLTHLFMVAATSSYQIAMSTSSFCKTEAVQTYRSLLKQRRRWLLGYITNEVCMLTDKRLWTRYPFLSLFRLAQNTIRTTTLLFFIIVISLITTSERIDELPVGFIVVSLSLNWILMAYFGLILRRYKIMLYPLLFILGPFLNWVFLIYGVFTAGQRTWGGPRADAGRADEVTAPRMAVERAEAMGDDLNVIPETFSNRDEDSALYNSPGPPKVSLRSSREFPRSLTSVSLGVRRNRWLPRSHTVPGRNTNTKETRKLMSTHSSRQDERGHALDSAIRLEDFGPGIHPEPLQTFHDSSSQQIQDDPKNALSSIRTGQTYNASSEWTDTDSDSDLGAQSGLFKFRDNSDSAASLALMDVSRDQSSINLRRTSYAASMPAFTAANPTNSIPQAAKSCLNLDSAEIIPRNHSFPWQFAAADAARTAPERKCARTTLETSPSSFKFGSSVSFLATPGSISRSGGSRAIRNKLRKAQKASQSPGQQS